MVGRLVEEKEVGALQQEAAERDPAPLATRERCDLSFARRTAQRVHRNFDRAVQFPGVGLVDLFLQFALLGDQGLHILGREILGEAGADRLEAVDQRLGLGEPLDDVAEDVLVGVERRLLRQEAGFRALGRPRFPGKLVFVTRHDPEERRLAGAVEAEDADLGAGEE